MGRQAMHEGVLHCLAEPLARDLVAVTLAYRQSKMDRCKDQRNQR